MIGLNFDGQKKSSVCPNCGVVKHKITFSKNIPIYYYTRCPKCRKIIKRYDWTSEFVRWKKSRFKFSKEEVIKNRKEIIRHYFIHKEIPPEEKKMLASFFEERFQLKIDWETKQQLNLKMVRRILKQNQQ